MKKKTKKGNIRVKNKSITKRKYKKNMKRGGMEQDSINIININIKTENETNNIDINKTEPILGQLKQKYNYPHIMVLVGGEEIFEENTAEEIGIESGSTLSLIIIEPTVFNVLSTTNEYNIPNEYIDLFYQSEHTQYGKGPPCIKPTMIEMGYYQEIENFIKENKAKIGDILFVGSRSPSRPIDCFAIVVENDKYIIGEDPNNGIHTVFSDDVLPIVKRYGIKYKKCLTDFSKSNMKYLWEDFIYGVEWDEEQIGYYEEENIW